jgi:hypothetical protein
MAALPRNHEKRRRVNDLAAFSVAVRVANERKGAVGASILSLIVMVIFARAAFGPVASPTGRRSPFLGVLFMTGIAFGVAAAAIVLRLGPASEWLIWPIPMIVSPFAGVSTHLRVAGMDAGGRGPPGRRPTCSRGCARWSPASPRCGAGSRSAGPGDCRSPPRLPRLHRRLPRRDPQRPHRPLQPPRR